MVATWSNAHEMAGLLAKRELAECLAELPDLPTDATLILLTECRIEWRRRDWTEAWWQWVSERVEPIGV